MKREDYQIHSDDGSRFCDCHPDENGEIILKGPKGMKMTFTSFLTQVTNPKVAYKKRGKRKK